MTMTLVGLGQRKVLNVNVGFRRASSVTAAPASSLQESVARQLSTVSLAGRVKAKTRPTPNPNEIHWKVGKLTFNFARCSRSEQTRNGSYHVCLEILKKIHFCRSDVMLTTVKRPRILVVEDEVIIARDIAMQLVNLGYEVVGNTTRGDQAVCLAGELRPDLVLMDIQLDGPMDGITAAQVIRTQYSLPVVFLTAFAADEVLARAKLSEPYGYILKPFSERELQTVLEMAVYKHQMDARLLISNRQLKALSRRVLEAQELERRRVAIELHDELGLSLIHI